MSLGGRSSGPQCFPFASVSNNVTVVWKRNINICCTGNGNEPQPYKNYSKSAAEVELSMWMYRNTLEINVATPVSSFYSKHWWVCFPEPPVYSLWVYGLKLVNIKQRFNAESTKSLCAALNHLSPLNCNNSLEEDEISLNISLASLRSYLHLW